MDAGYDYQAYFINQAGSGLSSYKRTFSSQEGRGIFSSFAKRVAIPLAKFFGKKVISGSRKIAPHLINSLATSATEGVGKLADKASDKLEQLGTGRKRKRRSTKTKRKSTKKAKRAKFAKNIFVSKKGLVLDKNQSTPNDIFG